MSRERSRADVLNREFLEVRSRILELAAALDRLDRAPAVGDDAPDGRADLLRQGLNTLLAPGPGRAEAVQQLFSLKYDPRWRENFQIAGERNGR